MAASVRWRKTGLVLPVAAALLLAGCGGSDPEARSGKDASGSSSPSAEEEEKDDEPDTGAIEEQLASTLPTDETIGYRTDPRLENHAQARGLTSRTIFHCTGTAVAKTDALRVTRVERRWLSKAWGNGGGPEVQVRFELVSYRGSDRAKALDEIKRVPTSCPEAYDEDGAARKNRFYRESDGIFNKRDVVAVFATLHYIKNDSTAYEVTFATEAGGHSLAMLVVISNDMRDLKRAVSRVVPVFKGTVERLDAAPGDLA
jgi:hypothetical protein